MPTGDDNQLRWLTYLAFEAVRTGRFRTQRELAEAAGLSNSLLSFITTGKRTASPSARRKLATALAGSAEAGRELLAELDLASLAPSPGSASKSALRKVDRDESPILWAFLEAPDRNRSHPTERTQNRWESRRRDQDLMVRTEKWFRSFGDVEEFGGVRRTGSIQRVDLTLRPDLHVPAYDLMVMVKTDLDRQDRLEATIGHAVVARSALGGEVLVVTDRRPDPLTEDALRSAGILIAWLERGKLRGEDLERILSPE